MHINETLTILSHTVKDAYDYQGRSYLHVPQDIDTDLRTDQPPEKCYLPKKHIHSWTGHTKGVASIKLFPNSGHLLLSCGMDSKIKASYLCTFVTDHPIILSPKRVPSVLIWYQCKATDVQKHKIKY